MFDTSSAKLVTEIRKESSFRKKQQKKVEEASMELGGGAICRISTFNPLLIPIPKRSKIQFTLGSSNL